MNPISTHSGEGLLARVNLEIEKISDLQHRLARQKTLLQEQATRLRLGASPAEVGVLLAAGVEVAL
jgi:hypothetical protein